MGQVSSLDNSFYGSNSESPATQAMVNIHPYLLAIATVVVLLYGIWAGFIFPLLEKVFRLPCFLKGYSHSSRVSMIIFAQAAVAGLISALCYIAFLQNSKVFASRNLVVFLKAIWQAFNYWRYHSEYRIGTALFWYIYALVFFDLALDLTFLFLPRLTLPPSGDTPVRSSERHGFIIAAHNSSDKLKATVEALLKFCRPYQIFVADNGSSPHEQAVTDRLCRFISNEYYQRNPHDDDGFQTPIQVSHIGYGNKTIAQYSSILQLHKSLENGTSSIDIVTLIDDDVLLPSFFPTDRIEREFEDPTKVVLAYPLRAENQDTSAMTALQDVEYLGGNMGRYLNNAFGTQLFASGAVATWKVPQLKHILDRHCTTFNGEDLEMGLLLHKLCDKETEKLGMNTTARIGYLENIVVPTIVPVHLMHKYDWLPNPLRRKCGIKPCPCGEHSLFNQRVRSWDPASYQFTLKMLKVSFSPRGGWYGPKLFIRVLCFWRVLMNLRDYSLVAGIVISMIGMTSIQIVTRFLTFYADFIFTSWMVGIVTGMVRSYCSSRMGHAVKPDILFAYPMLYGVTYGLFIRVVGVLYHVLYYLYAVRFPPDIRDQLKMDPEKKSVVESCWDEESDDGGATDYTLECDVRSMRSRRRTKILRSEGRSEGSQVPSSIHDFDSTVVALDLESADITTLRHHSSDEDQDNPGSDDTSDTNTIAEYGQEVLDWYLPSEEGSHVTLCDSESFASDNLSTTSNANSHESKP